MYLRGVDNAKFRRQVVPGDRLKLEVTMGPRRSSLARAHAVAYIDDGIVAEAELLLGLLPDAGPVAQRGMRADATAIIHPGAHIGGQRGGERIDLLLGDVLVVTPEQAQDRHLGVRRTVDHAATAERAVEAHDAREPIVALGRLEE